MLSPVFALLAMTSDPLLPITYEPPPPRHWVQSSTFSCRRGLTLRVSGYGVARPRERPVEVSFNGRPVTGSGVETLRRDLASRGAVYRLGVRCSRREASLNLFIHYGERTDHGEFIFRTGVAFIRDGRLYEYTGLGASDANTFWFR